MVFEGFFKVKGVLKKSSKVFENCKKGVFERMSEGF